MSGNHCAIPGACVAPAHAGLLSPLPAGNRRGEIFCYPSVGVSVSLTEPTTLLLAVSLGGVPVNFIVADALCLGDNWLDNVAEPGVVVPFTVKSMFRALL